MIRAVVAAVDTLSLRSCWARSGVAGVYGRGCSPEHPPLRIMAVRSVRCRRVRRSLPVCRVGLVCSAAGGRAVPGSGHPVLRSRVLASGGFSPVRRVPFTLARWLVWVHYRIPWSPGRPSPTRAPAGSRRARSCWVPLILLWCRPSPFQPFPGESGQTSSDGCGAVRGRVLSECGCGIAGMRLVSPMSRDMPVADVSGLGIGRDAAYRTTLGDHASRCPGGGGRERHHSRMSGTRPQRSRRGPAGARVGDGRPGDLGGR